MYTFPATQGGCVRRGSLQEHLGAGEILPTDPTSSQGSPVPTRGCPQASGGCQRGTSDDGASGLVLGQPLWVAFAVLVQVKAAGIDGRAGGRKANDRCHLSGSTRAEEGLNSAAPAQPQGPAWAPSSPLSGTEGSMPLRRQLQHQPSPCRFDLAPEAISFVDVEFAAPSQRRENILL